MKYNNQFLRILHISGYGNSGILDNENFFNHKKRTQTSVMFLKVSDMLI